MSLVASCSCRQNTRLFYMLTAVHFYSVNTVTKVTQTKLLVTNSQDGGGGGGGQGCWSSRLGV